MPRYFTASRSFGVRTVVPDRMEEGKNYFVFEETDATVQFIVHMYSATVDKAKLPELGSFTEFGDEDIRRADAAAEHVDTSREALKVAQQYAADRLQRLERTEQVLTELQASAEFDSVKTQSAGCIALFVDRVRSETRAADDALKAAESQLRDAESAYAQVEVLHSMIWVGRNCGKIPFPDAEDE